MPEVCWPGYPGTRTSGSSKQVVEIPILVTTMNGTRTHAASDGYPLRDMPVSIAIVFDSSQVRRYPGTR
eukprot:2087658-Rhodomonas_salina.1